MKFGLTEIEIKKIQQVFRLNLNVDKAILYGSRAKGNFKPTSDIDFTLIGLNLNLTTLNKIENELDDLLLPYKIDVSIHHHISNIELLQHIDRVGIPFYQKQL